MAEAVVTIFVVIKKISSTIATKDIVYISVYYIKIKMLLIYLFQCKELSGEING